MYRWKKNLDTSTPTGQGHVSDDAVIAQMERDLDSYERS